MTRALALVALFSGCLAGCFDPSLGDQPFVCAPNGKPCPDNYRCNGNNLCVPGSADDIGIDFVPPDIKESKEGPLIIDARPVQPPGNCLDAANEPNNTQDTAQEILRDGRSPDWEICYPLDIDYFSFDLDTGQSLEVKVIFKNADGDLDAALFDPEKTLVGQGRSDTDDETITLPTVTKKGRYVLAVFGFAGDTNKYDLQITRQ
ncbi:MAG: PPC domain-containing protein [Myxococcales bacterium]|nr:PPC domain-containing protein [Myxococcales bacterium]